MSGAAQPFRAILAAGLVLGLAASLPGHLSVDSVNALYEARNNIQATWAPVAFAWVVGLFDDALAGTGLYVTASSVLLFGTLMALPGLRPRASWLAVPAALVAVLTPQLLIYQGVVWRDVLFANLCVTGLILIGFAARRWTARPPWAALAGALVCLALAATIRQNGLILTLAGAAAIAWIAPGRLRGKLAWSLGWLAGAMLLGSVINLVAQPPRTAPNLRPAAGLRILQHYDVVGAAAHDPGLRLDEIAGADPRRAQIIRAGAAALYSPVRVDSLDPKPDFRRSLWRTPDAVMTAQWLAVMREHPGAYLAHRSELFRWVFMTPRLELCLPVHVGVEGPAGLVAGLGLANGRDPADRALAGYAARFYGTPVYSHLTYALVSLGLIGFLAFRRDPADKAMIALQGGALAFAASFFVVSIACDYRYLYVLDLAALTGVLYLALDPRLTRAAPRPARD